MLVSVGKVKLFFLVKTALYISHTVEPQYNKGPRNFLKNLTIYKECISSLTFCHPVILQFLIVAIFFVTDCKELKLAQTA